MLTVNDDVELVAGINERSLSAGLLARSIELFPR